MRFPGLVENEILKFARQRRFRGVLEHSGTCDE